MTSQREKINKVNELKHFSEAIEQYLGYISLHKKKGLTDKQETETIKLRDALLEDTGRFKGLITELTGKEGVTIDTWLEALELPYGSSTITKLLHCADVTRMAVGKFKLDIEQGIRDGQGNLIEEPVKSAEQIRPEYQGEQTTLLSATSGKANWKAIESEFGINKKSFGIKIKFITNHFKRIIIFRDVEQAFVLASLGFSKPAVILAGSVIEELLRLYLECKNISPISDNFDGYIRTCEQHGLLKDSVSRLSHSVRQFRNLVHLSVEENKKHTLSKATAIGAVSSIFTIASDF